MKFSIRYADKIVGTLVILGLAMVVFVILMLGSNQRWFKNDQLFKTYLTSASGININMAIQLRGFTVGNIRGIELTEGDRVEITFSIYEEYTHRITVGSLVEFQESPIGLGSTFILHPGPLTNDLIDEGGLIPEMNSPEATVLIAAGLTVRPYGGHDNINAIVGEVRTLLETLNLSLAGEEREERSLTLVEIFENVRIITADIAELTGERLNPVMDNLETITADAAVITSSLSDPSGVAMTSLEDSIVSIAGIIESLNQTAEFLPTQLPQIAALISQLNPMLVSVQDVLTALANNPLLRGGIPQQTETSPGGAGPRNLDF
ncbi:MAG: MlaD family protein [Treponema sp.]|nr:MlaD family protein [Treponema sp.]